MDMISRGNRNVDVPPGLAEQLAKKVHAAELGATPRSQLLADIETAKRTLQKDSTKNAERIIELEALLREYSESPNDGGAAAAMEETRQELEMIMSGSAESMGQHIYEVQGGNGSEQQLAVEVLSLGQELTQAIEAVTARIASLDDDKKKAALEKRLELLRVYQKIKPRSRNVIWEANVRGVLADIQSIERPKQKRAPRPRAEPQIQQDAAPIVEAPVAETAPKTPEARAIPERAETSPEARQRIITQAQEALRTITDKLGSGRESPIIRSIRDSIQQAQAHLGRIAAIGASERHLDRIQAVVEKLQASAAGWTRGSGRQWEKEVGQHAFDFEKALEIALPPTQERRRIVSPEEFAAAGEARAPELPVSPEAEQREPYITETEFDPVKAAALYTIDKLKRYKELSTAEDGTPLAPEERQERFRELVKKYWTEFTLHGTRGKEIDPATGKIKIEPWSDLDGSACLFLLREAGIAVDKSRVNYVAQGGLSESGVVLDTSDKTGVIAEEHGKRLTIDHHAPGTPRRTSASKLLYETFSNPEIGLLPKEQWLENFVAFVTKEDGKDFTNEEAKALFDNYGHNFASFFRNLDFDQMKKFFKEMAGKPFGPYDRLPDEYLKKFTFIYNLFRRDSRPRTFEQVRDYSERHKQESIAAIKALEAQEGSVVDTGENRYGKVLVDRGKQDASGKWQRNVPMDFDAVRQSGYGAYLVWLPESKQFFLKTVKEIDFEVPEVPDAYNVRGHYLLKGDPKTALQITKEELLDKLAGTQSPATEQRATVATEAADVYDPEQGVGAPQAPERAEDAEVVAPVEAAYRKRTLAEFERESARSEERVRNELRKRKQELKNLLDQYQSSTDTDEKPRIVAVYKQKKEEFLRMFKAFEDLKRT